MKRDWLFGIGIGFLIAGMMFACFDGWSVALAMFIPCGVLMFICALIEIFDPMPEDDDTDYYYTR